MEGQIQCVKGRTAGVETTLSRAQITKKLHLVISPTNPLSNHKKETSGIQSCFDCQANVIIQTEEIHLQLLISFKPDSRYKCDQNRKIKH